jgi:intein-encoded DNA endonuclease-like protein
MLTEINPWYIAGFFDGEGSLTVRMRRDPRYRSGQQFLLKINITQKNKEVLELIKKKYPAAKLYFHNRDKLWYLEIYQIEEIYRFCAALRGKVVVKATLLEKFFRVIEEMKKQKHRTRQGANKIKNLWMVPETGANAG